MDYLRLTIVFVLALLLVASFGLHSIEFKHNHPSASHTHQQDAQGKVVEIDEYVHGIEQKFFVLFLLSFLAFSLFILLTPSQLFYSVEYRARKYHQKLKLTFIELVHFLTALFMSGILHPKLH